MIPLSRVRRHQVHHASLLPFPPFLLLAPVLLLVPLNQRLPLPFSSFVSKPLWAIAPAPLAADLSPNAPRAGDSPCSCYCSAVATAGPRGCRSIVSCRDSLRARAVSRLSSILCITFSRSGGSSPPSPDTLILGVIVVVLFVLVLVVLVLIFITAAATATATTMEIFD